MWWVGLGSQPSTHMGTYSVSLPRGMGEKNLAEQARRFMGQNRNRVVT